MASKKHRPKAFLKNRLFVREKYVKPIHTEAFTYTFKERTYDEMFGEYVMVEKTYESFERVRIKGKKWVAFNCGDDEKIKKVFKKFRIIDRRSKPKLGFKLKFRATLKPEQKTITKFWLKKKGFGIIHAPVRWGKTYGSGYIICKLGTTTLVLSDKAHLCKQWEKDLRKMTNISAMERKLGRRLVGRFKKTGKNKYKTYPITLATFQGVWAAEKRCKFITKNRKKFGLVWVDECHHSPAVTYSKGITGFSAQHKGGVSGTVKRRDQKHLLMHDIIGSITAEGTTEQMACKVVRHMTEYYVNPKSGWAWMVSAVVKNDEFNEQVAEMAAKQARKDRFVLIHTERTQHCNVLKDKIQEFDPKLGVEILTGKVNIEERDRIIDSMTKGDTKVIIGSRVMQEGITFPRADVLHVGFSPVTNDELWKQISGRVRTPFEGKPTPIIHDWRLKGHGGLYASGKVRDKYWEKMKWKVKTKYQGIEGKDTGDDLAKDESSKVPRLCGNCKYFFKCKRKDGVRARSEICKDFKVFDMKPREKLQIVTANSDLVQLGSWPLRFVESLKEQQDAYWSNKQKAMLSKIYEDVINHKDVTTRDVG